MCISDWRLGRFMSINIQPFNITTGAGITLPSNRQRVGLQICPTVLLSTTQGFRVNVNGVASFVCSGLAPRVFLTLDENGILVQQSFSVTDLLAATTGAYTEIILPERYLSAGMDEFMSKYQLT